MKVYNYNQQNPINVLVSEYEAMSQQGTVGFLEETVFQKIISHYREDNRPDQAIGALDHALNQHPYFSEFYLLKAQMLLEKGCRQLALDCLEQAEVNALNALEIHLMRAEIFASLGYVEDALESLERAKLLATKAQLSEVFFCESCIYEHLEDFDQMFFALRKAVILEPGNKSVLKRLWYCIELSRRYKESVELHKHLIDLDPYCAISWYNLGHAYSCLKEYDKAAESFEYAYLIDENFSLAYKDCAAVWIKKKAYKKALNCFQDALEHIKADAEMFVNIGYCFEQLEDNGMAQAFYLKAITLDPTDDAAYFRLGECLAQNRQWGKAIEAYHNAVELNENLEEYKAALAEAYYQTDQLELAAEFFQAATDTAPEQVCYWVQYASFLIEVNQMEEALQAIEDAIVFTGGDELLYCKSAILILMDQREEGLILLNKALQDSYDVRQSFFDFAPELEDDREVQTVLAIYA